MISSYRFLDCNFGKNFEHWETCSAFDNNTASDTNDLTDALLYVMNELNNSRTIPIVGNTLFNIDENAYKLQQPTRFDVIKCECGAESIGYNTHSSWCAKYDC